MEEILFELQLIVGNVWNSPWFGIVKFLVALYTIVLFLDIVMILILRGVGADWKKSVYGADMPVAHKKQTVKMWKSVRDHLNSHQSDEWKIAILEADRITDSILESSGFSGENFRERVEGASYDRLERRDELLRVHEVRNTIIRDRSFEIDQETARQTVGVYEQFLRDWEAL